MKGDLKQILTSILDELRLIRIELLKQSRDVKKSAESKEEMQKMLSDMVLDLPPQMQAVLRPFLERMK